MYTRTFYFSGYHASRVYHNQVTTEDEDNNDNESIENYLDSYYYQQQQQRQPHQQSSYSAVSGNSGLPNSWPVAANGANQISSNNLTEDRLLAAPGRRQVVSYNMPQPLIQSLSAENQPINEIN